MKQIFFAVAFLAAAFAAGCAGAQQSASPITYTCPAAALGGPYTEINAPTNTGVAASITGSAFIWTPPAAAAYCFTVQTWALPIGATVYQTSVPSNVVEIAIPANDQASLSWAPPGANSAFGPYSYIVSYALAIPSSVPTAPTQTTPTAVASLDKPGPTLAKKLPAPGRMIATVTR